VHQGLHPRARNPLAVRSTPIVSGPTTTRYDDSRHDVFHVKHPAAPPRMVTAKWQASGTRYVSRWSRSRLASSFEPRPRKAACMDGTALFALRFSHGRRRRRAASPTFHANVRRRIEVAPDASKSLNYCRQSLNYCRQRHRDRQQKRSIQLHRWQGGAMVNLFPCR